MNLVWGFDMLIKKHVFLPMSQIYYASRLLNYVIINLLVLLRFLKSLDLTYLLTLIQISNP